MCSKSELSHTRGNFTEVGIRTGVLHHVACTVLTCPPAALRLVLIKLRWKVPQAWPTHQLNVNGCRGACAWAGQLDGEGAGNLERVADTDDWLGACVHLSHTHALSSEEIVRREGSEGRVGTVEWAKGGGHRGSAQLKAERSRKKERIMNFALRRELQEDVVSGVQEQQF